MADPLARLRAKREPGARFQTAPVARQCGECTLCCQTLVILELGKAWGASCAHLAADGPGCGIWRERPQTCRTFFCLWRVADHLLPDALFPAQSGVFVFAEQIATWPATLTVVCDPARPDAWQAAETRRLLGALARAWNCFVGVAAASGEMTAAFTPAREYVGEDARRALTDPSIGDDFGPDRRAPGEIMRTRQRWWAAASVV